MLAHGAAVAAVDIRPVGPFSAPVVARRWDLAEIGTLGDLAGSVEAELGPLDILVNNVAVMREDRLLELTYDAYRRVVSVDLDSPLFLALAVARSMARRGYGRIVNVTSVHARYGFEQTLSYGVAKAGLENATKSLAVGLAQYGVLVNAVAPGFLAVPMQYENAPASPEAVQSELDAFQQSYVATGRLPLRRAASASEIAAQVVWLASEENSYMSGHVLVVDGGLSATF
jgi:3-oxoacyl-[acyl-carrier protein] reductase